MENAKDRDSIKILGNGLGEETVKNQTEIFTEVEILVMENKHLQTRLKEENISYQDTIELFEKANAKSKAEFFKILLIENIQIQTRLNDEYINYQGSIKMLEKRFAEENAISRESIDVVLYQES